MKHHNGARLVTESIICAVDPERYASKYSLYAGRDYTSVNGHFRIDVGAGTRIIVLPPERVGEIVPGGAAPAEPSMVGFTVAVTDMDNVRELLNKNQVSFQEFRGRLVVAAADACGSFVLFEA